MDHWKQIIERANALFAQGQWVEAREHYLRALALAQILFARWGNPDEAVAAFVVAHHNLADLHLHLHQPEESAEYLCAAHEQLLDAAHRHDLPGPLREAALRHSNRTYTELLEFIAVHGEYPRAASLLAGAMGQQSRHPGAHPRYGVH
ncbi:tetratricopeptide repeat protein [Pseudomonas sp. RIT-PI-S]|uniref:tetratricopeptide repeat protein n=1 Tax=Pseudomonas sp. RIT-PI-S TaxID=3035295 RepID=UPI0021DAE5BF|nr:tetratricopeptide repeat protein [Pseudomonas sp. RIT-PI-S]